MSLILGLFAIAQWVPAGFLPIPPEVKLGAMSAVAADARSGDLYVLHRGEPPILRYDSKRRYKNGWGTGQFKVAHGLRVDDSGNVWTTDNGLHRIQKWSRKGELLQTIDGLKSPDDLAFSKDGSIFIADTGNARIVQHTGVAIKNSWGQKGKADGEFGTAHGLAIDANDRIYVADRGNNRVQVFDTSGKHLATWSGFGNPFGLLWTRGRLLVSDGDAHKVIELDENGKVAAEWGNGEMLKLPHLMTIGRDGTLYIAEVNGQRVQMFRRAK